MKYISDTDVLPNRQWYMGLMMDRSKFLKGVRNTFSMDFKWKVKQKNVVEYWKVPQSTVANIIRGGKSSSTEKRGWKQKSSARGVQNFYHIPVVTDSLL